MVTIQAAPNAMTKISTRDMEVTDLVYQQNPQMIKPWVSTYNLRLIKGTWYKDARWVVTGGMHDKRTIIGGHHEPQVYGHLGIKRTTQLVKCSYWWPGLRRDVLEYVKGCAECQQNKVNNQPTHAPLVPIPPKVNALPFETVTLDFITKLPVSEGYDSILTITDHDCTKAAVFIPCNEEITVDGTAKLYVKHIFLQYRLPS